MKILIYIFVFIFSFIFGWGSKTFYNKERKPETLISKVIPRPLDKYTIENLSKRYLSNVSDIKIEKIIKTDTKFTSHLYTFTLDPTISDEAPRANARGIFSPLFRRERNPSEAPLGGAKGDKEPKKISGQISIPKGEGPFPIIVMFRGYVDQKEYKTGDGTRRAAEFFAQNRFITVAPDFLGYGESDHEAENIFESRFQTYITALGSIKSLNTIEKWDKKNILIWGHSNGGQIALTILEITQGIYPTILWAPVSKPFPYSVLYYTDESDDKGKLIRRELANFEKTYDVELYSLTNYLDRIKAPLQIHQGSRDDAVPKDWTDSLVKKLNKNNSDLAYFVYPGADHNLQPVWNTVINRDLQFFKQSLN